MIQRDVDPVRDKKLNKMLDGKYGHQIKRIVTGDTLRTIKSLLEQKQTLEKQATRRKKPAARTAGRQAVRSVARRLGVTASSAGRRAGAAAQGAARGVARAAESTYRRGRAARMRRQVMRQPTRHAARALGHVARAGMPSFKPNVPARIGRLGRAGREAARAVGSMAPARRARTMDRRARSQFGLTGPKVKRPYGVKPRKPKKMTKTEQVNSIIKRLNEILKAETR